MSRGSLRRGEGDKVRERRKEGHRRSNSQGPPSPSRKGHEKNFSVFGFCIKFYFKNIEKH